ncbi:MAG: alpha amylase C-terminal domain-containing protein [Bacteroidales bacterium]|nr:alpha amylase C-terminal domain-containing protein [Candidatus Cryptobacteroides aphodequi]
MKRIYENDPWLEPFKDAIDARHDRIEACRRTLLGRKKRLSSCFNNHLWYGLHFEEGHWVFREWAPNATRIYLIGEFNNWKRTEGYRLQPCGNGDWEITLPDFFLHHGQLYKLWIEWSGGGAERLPSYARRVVQDPESKVFCAQVWQPAEPYRWRHKATGLKGAPFIYECHIGMSGEKEAVATFEDFRRDVLPRVARLGYNVIQIMALQEHPYYGSFGYQVSNFFALSSRFGTPEEFKALVDDAHSRGIAVVMDIVHSHMVKNEAEGLSRFDGREDLYFYDGWQGHHPAWDSRCFDYGKPQTLHFLLSNCKFWMQEYRLDGFRFDGVTSMLYWNHGLETDFGSYSQYFGNGVDENAITYLALANLLVHDILPGAVTIAEDMSGMAGLAAPIEAGGVGFDYRMAMGIADHWIKWIKELPDEQWSMGSIWWELTNKRADERTVSYAECHDQALVGDKTIIFRLMDKEMYYGMQTGSRNLTVERGVALHKLIRLVTAATAGGGYLTFMGNEFGHPEWIDFPREGNGWSYKYARRQWSLADNPDLRYAGLEAFDAALVHFLRGRNLLESVPECLQCDDQSKVLVFKRADVIFALNFNPVNSYEGYEFAAPSGLWRMAFNSDEKRFGGFDRLQSAEAHTTTGNNTLKLYLPSRCALVLYKE